MSDSRVHQPRCPCTVLEGATQQRHDRIEHLVGQEQRPDGCNVVRLLPQQLRCEDPRLIQRLAWPVASRAGLGGGGVVFGCRSGLRRNQAVFEHREVDAPSQKKQSAHLDRAFCRFWPAGRTFLHISIL